MKTKKLAIETRFWNKVNKNNKSECWLWTACTRGTNGYGVFKISKELGEMSAHRYSYELDNGPIPKGMLICHICDNPICVNPHHLFLGTHKDNAIDREKKNRNKSHGTQKLTEDQVKEIIQSNISQSKLSKIYKVSRTTISNIQHGNLWKKTIANTTIGNNLNICSICNTSSHKNIFIDINYQYRKISDDLCLKCSKLIRITNLEILKNAVTYLENKQ